MIKCKIRELKDQIGKLKHNKERLEKTIQKLENMPKTGVDRYGVSNKRKLEKAKIALVETGVNIRRNEVFINKLVRMKTPETMSSHHESISKPEPEPETMSSHHESILKPEVSEIQKPSRIKTVNVVPSEAKQLIASKRLPSSYIKQKAVKRKELSNK